MDNLDSQKAIRQATEMIEIGKCEKAYEILKPLLLQKNSEAIFLYSQFSLSKMETEEEFEKRSVALLQIAARAGFPPAIYALAVCYDTGDLQEKDASLASELFLKAAEAGYSKAKLSHGLNLYYGSNGITKNHVLGLKFIRQAVDEKVEDAHKILTELEKNTNKAP